MRNNYPIFTKLKHSLLVYLCISHTKFERDRVKTVEIQARNACRTRNSKAVINGAVDVIFAPCDFTNNT